ncbi:helix-turn-helix domain-containing protein [Rivularia sp. PCC 7116]|uniref:helix-turn-helix domain-containing protein n=1 Tax=Rivularia sp. PCC 7116 TaxID=373994 RepID=UPI0007C487EF|nr:helix-turn-helix transcriptional regulator [Rivularia sp. PCC 7116]
MQSTSNQQTTFGNLLKHHRKLRNFSQLDLALASDVSQRHISFLESGRANPSQEMILQLATVLDIPLREQNVMLTTAGFAPIYSESDLSSPEFEPIRKALDFILLSQTHSPVLIMDRYWNLIQTNPVSQRLINWLIDSEDLHNRFYIDGKINLMRLMLHSQGLKPFVSNWEEIVSHLIKRVYREAIADDNNEQPRQLYQELMTYPDIPQLWKLSNSQSWQMPLLTVNFFKAGLHLNFFSAIATLGTPQDIMLQELRIETLFPADEITQKNLVELN